MITDADVARKYLQLEANALPVTSSYCIVLSNKEVICVAIQ